MRPCHRGSRQRPCPAARQTRARLAPTEWSRPAAAGTRATDGRRADSPGGLDRHGRAFPALRARAGPATARPTRHSSAPPTKSVVAYQPPDSTARAFANAPSSINNPTPSGISRRSEGVGGTAWRRTTPRPGAVRPPASHGPGADGGCRSDTFLQLCLLVGMGEEAGADRLEAIEGCRRGTGNTQQQGYTCGHAPRHQGKPDPRAEVTAERQAQSHRDTTRVSTESVVSRPSRRTTARSAYAATRASCVTRTTDAPCSRAAPASSSMSSGTREPNWKTNPNALARKRLRCPSLWSSIRLPQNWTCPESGRRIPARQCRSVDFPDPEGPSSVRSRPAAP